MSLDYYIKAWADLGRQADLAADAIRNFSATMRCYELDLIAAYRKATGRKTGGAMKTWRLRKKALDAAERWEAKTLRDAHRQWLGDIRQKITGVRIIDPSGDVARYNDERAAMKADIGQAMEDLASRRDSIATEEKRQARETMRHLDEMSIVDRGIAIAGVLSAKIANTREE